MFFAGAAHLCIFLYCREGNNAFAERDHGKLWLKMAWMYGMMFLKF